MSAPRVAFVLGCQRSGTTLLRFLLGAHADVRSIDEELAYPVLTGRQQLDELIEADAPRALVVFKIPRFSEQLLLPDVRDELYGTCAQFYRGEPGVFVVRDPRDVVASMCSLKAGRDASWIGTYGRIMLEHRLAERSDFLERHGALLDELRRRDWPDHLVAAAYWRVKNAALLDYSTANLPILPIAYERLVAEPRPVLEAICSHLQLPWHDRMLHHEQVEHDQLSAAGLAIGDSNPKRAIDRDSVGRFRKLLDPALVAEVETNTADLFGALQRLTGS